VPDDSVEDTVDPEGSQPVDLSEQVPPEVINLPSGSDLTPEAGGRIAAACLTRLVLLAGEAESGKTTLLATIYEKFNEGDFADLVFAGSATLVGWEKRCHLARVASGAEKADTERTLGLQQRLLHLRVRDKSLAEPPQDLLLTDLSGEAFKLIKDSTDECQKLGMLKRADHFVLLVDGRKLAARGARHEAQNNGMALLRSCVDAGMVGSNSFVDVVFSKYDLLAPVDRDTSEFLKHIVDTIKRRFERRLGRLRFHNVAARPKSGTIEYAFGIPDLLRSWTEDSPYFVSRLSLPVQLPLRASMFDSYLRVRFPDFAEIRSWK